MLSDSCNSLCDAQVSLSNKHDLFIGVYFLTKCLIWVVGGSLDGITRFFFRASGMASEDA